MRMGDLFRRGISSFNNRHANRNLTALMASMPLTSIRNGASVELTIPRTPEQPPSDPKCISSISMSPLSAGRA